MGENLDSDARMIRLLADKGKPEMLAKQKTTIHGTRWIVPGDEHWVVCRIHVHVSSDEDRGAKKLRACGIFLVGCHERMPIDIYDRVLVYVPPRQSCSVDLNVRDPRVGRDDRVPPGVVVRLFGWRLTHDDMGWSR